MFCPECGTPNDDDSIFCGNCGAVLGTDDSPPSDEVVVPEGVTVEAIAEPEEWGGVPEETPPGPAPPPVAYPSPMTTAPPIPTNGLAITSLVLGIAGLTVLPLLASIAAIIVGYMARNDIRQRPGEVSGDGLAVAGIVMGWISVGITVLVVLGFGASICGFGLCGIASGG